MIARPYATHAMFRHSSRVHFVGIGGTGMCGIAEVLLNLGYEISGSDIASNEAIFRLRGLGAKVVLGHREENVAGVDVLVYSSAVTGENVEVAEARRRKIPVIKRAEMLSELMRMKYSIGVAGTHGKTTTTSFIAAALAAGGLDPTVVVGGRINALGSNARMGEGEYLVAEADESDGTFLRLTPTIAIVTNIDEEHLDYYENYGAIKTAFLEFVNKVPFYGFSLLCLDHPAIQEIIPRVEKQFFTYGFGTQADYVGEEFRYENGETVFGVKRHGERLGEIRLLMPGRHNADNALAAAAVSLELDVSFGDIQRGLHEFDGIGRRLERVGEASDVTIFDDYGIIPRRSRSRSAPCGRPGRRVAWWCCFNRIATRERIISKKPSTPLFMMRTGCSSHPYTPPARRPSRAWVRKSSPRESGRMATEAAMQWTAWRRPHIACTRR